jgi:polyhydroxybutyrate depolymerase
MTFRSVLRRRSGAWMTPRRSFLRPFATAILCAASAGTFASGASPDRAASIEVHGTQRTYLIHEPSRQGGLRPLVLVFHGGTRNGAHMSAISHFDRVADEHGFVVVFPDGLKKHWNDGRGIPEATADDVAFTRALIAHLVKDDRIDPKRVFATGYSNGGLFSYRLACELAGLLTGIAPVAATVSVPVSRTCAPVRSVPVAAFNGTLDPYAQYRGGIVNKKAGGRGFALSAEASFSLWTKLDHCDGKRVKTSLPKVHSGDPTSVTLQTACNGAVRLYTIEGGGHTWPGGAVNLHLPEAAVGKVSHQIDASETIWSFFSSL